MVARQARKANESFFVCLCAALKNGHLLTEGAPPARRALGRHTGVASFTYVTHT